VVSRRLIVPAHDVLYSRDVSGLVRFRWLPLIAMHVVGLLSKSLERYRAPEADHLRHLLRFSDAGLVKQPGPVSRSAACTGSLKTLLALGSVWLGAIVGKAMYWASGQIGVVGPWDFGNVSPARGWVILQSAG
jgi:hypothetical protein